MGLHALQSGYMLSEYRIEKLLGEGGFGLTYLAFDTNLEKKVAIKEYMPSDHAIRKDDSQILAKSDSSKKTYDWGLNAFLNEAKILAKFEDSNIVRIHRFFKANGTAYIVMEYCEGGCLIDRISKTKHMNENVLIKIVTAISHGLQLVHNEGILHRDIKPDNIMFRQDGTPVLIDFGAARQAIGTKSRKVTTIITPGYAPLEQYSAKGEIGPWSDIYSLAAVAYLCITGNRPPDIMNRLHEDTLEKIGVQNDSSAFLKSIDLGLELHAAQRPQSLSEWSTSWGNNDIPKAVEFITKENQIPIFANRDNQTNKKTALRQPISARTSLRPDEQTVVQSEDIKINYNTNSSFSILRVIFSVVILSGLIFAGLFGYDYYLKWQNTHNTNTLEQQQKIIQVKQKPQINELVRSVQLKLNKLGYTVKEDGEIDTRTLESIKSFERKNKLVETGSVDNILLSELNKALERSDNQAWQQAIDSNSINGFQNYLTKYPNGLYANQVSEVIENIRIEKENKIKQLDETEQKNQQRLNQITLRKAQLITNIQKEFKRLKYANISLSGKLDESTKNQIIAYQNLKKLKPNGLPTKTLLFQLKKESKWPGKQIGEISKDCDLCPTMVVIPAGNFMMGSKAGESNESPYHNVNLQEFMISQTEVTFKQWDTCFDDGFCTHRPNDEQLGRNNQAVMNVNWFDTQQFIKWLNNKTAKTYSLPSEAQWEYAARAGTTTKYSWGDDIGNNNASCNGCNSGIDNNKINQVKNYQANAFDLYDMHGNVWEWIADCWHPNYSGAPSDEQAWEPNGCNNYVVRGGSGGNKPTKLRSASRGVMSATKRLNSLGFRVVLN